MQAELQKIERAKENYQTALRQNIDQGYYPFSSLIEQQLKDLQTELQLIDSEVAGISKAILEQAEADYQEKQQRDYQNNLQRYQQEFIRAIKAEYPLSDFVTERLKQFQQQLDLKITDIEKIEQDLIAAKEKELQEKRQREQREYESNLQRYQKEFTKAIEAEYPLSHFVTEGLKDFQQQLGLRDSDVEKIEKPLIDAKGKEIIKQKPTE